MKTADEVLHELNSIVDGWSLSFDTTEYAIQLGDSSGAAYVFFNQTLLIEMTYWTHSKTYSALHRKVVFGDRQNAESGERESAFDAYIGLQWIIRMKAKELLNIINEMNKDRKNGNS
ncbi:hypothetical protein FDG95_gp355 [Pectobacterium phage vB_PcaM_CBB]|uniref:Uncharacterized protein n=1 Tax=Pectobacterium phage vB_PcaM_CBB TaxID=2772511 RepID=A0A1L2CV70_9CAUD|nr:hypothetical protein FDG95_gp355 [Pectobacterium phage vB_PcaM_CBB]AMM43918.1 hypothetical protein CBB_355 [Pectobacterium phage vB_PcaM_CBB]